MPPNWQRVFRLFQQYLFVCLAARFHLHYCNLCLSGALAFLATGTLYTIGLYGWGYGCGVREMCPGGNTWSSLVAWWPALSRTLRARLR